MLTLYISDDCEFSEKKRIENYSLKLENTSNMDISIAAGGGAECSGRAPCLFRPDRGVHASSDRGGSRKKHGGRLCAHACGTPDVFRTGGLIQSHVCIRAGTLNGISHGCADACGYRGEQRYPLCGYREPIKGGNGAGGGSGAKRSASVETHFDDDPYHNPFYGAYGVRHRRGKRDYAGDGYCHYRRACGIHCADFNADAYFLSDYCKEKEQEETNRSG